MKSNQYQWTKRIVGPLVVLAIGSQAVGVLIPLAQAAPLAQPNWVLTDDLVAYWPLSEVSGTRVDVTGRDNDLDSFGDPGNSVGKVGNAVQLDPDDQQFLSRSSTEDLELGDIDFTIAGWFKAASFNPVGSFPENGARHLVSKWKSPHEYLVALNADGSLSFLIEDGVSEHGWSTGPGAVSLNVWNYFVVWHDSVDNAVGIRLNGQEYTFPYTGGVNTSSENFTIGRNDDVTGGASYFDGLIDEVGVWKRLLTLDERIKLYNDAHGCTHPFSNCAGPRPPGNIPNWLANGNFEQSLSGNWQTVGFSNPSSRVNQNSPTSSGYGGAAYCSNWYTNIVGNGISQRFYWPGGNMRVSFRLRKKEPDLSLDSYPQVELTNVNLALTLIVVNGKDGENLHRDPGESQWVLYQETLNLSAGYYDLHFYNIDYDPGGTIISGGTAVSIPATWSIQSDPAQDYNLDDVFVSQNQYYSHCSGPGGATITPFPTPTSTPTPSKTPTPTKTNTNAPTATPSRTPTANVPPTFGNCNFENGSNGWFGDLAMQFSGGPIGPQYARVPPGGTMYQPLTWGGGNIYLTFWVGPGSNGYIRMRNMSTFQATTLWTGTGSSWSLKSATNSLPSGSYRLEVVAQAGAPMLVDGVLISSNTYAYCGSNNGGPVTPTTGPTAYVTLTPSKTPTTGATFTPLPTLTQTPSRTPNATLTPKPATVTPPPSNTPENFLTATSQAQITPTPTQVPMPPEEPLPAWDAPCDRPDNAYNLAWWGEYGTCYALSWFSWSPGNTLELQEMMHKYDDREPFGSFNEFSGASQVFIDQLNSQDWQDSPQDYTGIDTGNFTDPDSIYDGESELTFGGGVNYADLNCNIDFPGAGGAFLKGVCFMFAFLEYWQFLPYFQWYINGAALFLFIAYLVSKWISKASNA